MRWWMIGQISSNLDEKPAFIAKIALSNRPNNRNAKGHEENNRNGGSGDLLRPARGGCHGPWAPPPSNRGGLCSLGFFISLRCFVLKRPRTQYLLQYVNVGCIWAFFTSFLNLQGLKINVYSLALAYKLKIYNHF